MLFSCIYYIIKQMRKQCGLSSHSLRRGLSRPYSVKQKEGKAIEPKDWIGSALTAWANIIATLTLIHAIRQDKKKATHRDKPHKQKRK